LRIQIYTRTQKLKYLCLYVFLQYYELTFMPLESEKRQEFCSNFVFLNRFFFFFANIRIMKGILVIKFFYKTIIGMLTSRIGVWETPLLLRRHMRRFPVAIYVVLSFNWKCHFALVLLVRRVITVDEWFATNGHFFSFSYLFSFF